MTQPTQEQVEAARNIVRDMLWTGPMFDGNLGPNADYLAAFLAARDAERDARWRKVVEDWPCECSSAAPVECSPCAIRAALANLGVEEKPKGVRLDCVIMDDHVAPKPEPKCGECGGRETVLAKGARFEYQREPCPSCSGGKQ